MNKGRITPDLAERLNAYPATAKAGRVVLNYADGRYQVVEWCQQAKQRTSDGRLEIVERRVQETL